MKNITETKVTHIVTRSGTDQDLRNISGGRTVFFINSNAENLIDEWFEVNDIGSLAYKCRSWDWLTDQCTREIASVIRQHFTLSDRVNIAWSAYAGCTCRCSKGYIMEYAEGFEHSRKHLHMDVLLDEAAINRLKYCIVQATKKLLIEKTKHELMEMKDPSVQQLTVTA